MLTFLRISLDKKKNKKKGGGGCNILPNSTIFIFPIVWRLLSDEYHFAFHDCQIITHDILWNLERPQKENYHYHAKKVMLTIYIYIYIYIYLHFGLLCFSISLFPSLFLSFFLSFSLSLSLSIYLYIYSFSLILLLMKNVGKIF